MPIIKTKRGIERQAIKAIHHPPTATEPVKVSKEMQDEKRKMVRELVPFLMYLYKKYMGAKISESAEGTDLDMLKLINKAMKQMPGSLAQKKTIAQLNKMRTAAGMKPLKEDINIPIKVGDTVLGGKFKNKRIVVKSIGKNEKGDITINGKPLLKYRILDESTLSEFGGVRFDAIGYDKNGKEVDMYLPRANNGFEKNIVNAAADKLFKSGKGVEYIEVYYDKHHLGTIKKPRTFTKGKDWSKLPINEQKYYVAIHRPGLKPHLDRKTDVKADKILDEPKVFNSIADARDHIQSYKRFNRMHGYKGIKFWVSDLKMNKIDESTINEIPMGDLQKIDQFADKQLNPVDIVLTDKHFFDRLNDPRNGKEISNAELIGFFKRLAKHKKEFVEFLEKYNSVVAVDDRTNINIPFMKQANKAIAKTVMRKKDFKTPDKKLDI